MRVNLIGGGNMAQALLFGMLERKAAKGLRVGVADPDDGIRRRLEATGGVDAVPDASGLPAADVTVIAVKPFHLSEAVRPWTPDGMVVSVVAGARIATIARLLGGHGRIVRAMPNTPALFGKGVTGLFAAPEVSPPDRAAAETLFTAVGATVWVGREDDLDSVTAVSGSGPAYVFRFFEALEQAALACGLGEEDARTLALSTVEGAVHMLGNSGKSAAELRAAVTSKGGTTAAALAVLQECGFAETVAEAVKAAKQRSREIADETDRG